MESEIWKDIEWYEGLYKISEHSKIKSLRDNFWRKREKIIVPTLWKNWYLKIVLYKNWKSNTKLVHRLKAIAFIPNPLNLPVVMHIDNIKFNLDLDNLKWGTHKENNYQIIAEGRNNFTNWNHPDLGKKRWENKWARKVNQYSREWVFIKTFDCIKDWAMEVCIKYTNICRACKSWQMAGGYRWTYYI